MDVITSPSNPAVRAARKLARPSSRARADGRFLLEGPEGIRTALEAGHLPEPAGHRAGAAPTPAWQPGRQRGARSPWLRGGAVRPGRHHHPPGLVSVLPAGRPLADCRLRPAWSACCRVRDPGNSHRAARGDAFGPDAVSRPQGRSNSRAPRRLAPPSAVHLRWRRCPLAGAGSALRVRVRLVRADRSRGPVARPAAEPGPLSRQRGHGLPARSRPTRPSSRSRAGRAETTGRPAASAVRDGPRSREAALADSGPT